CRIVLFFFSAFGDHRALHSFPTRRSSDLPDGEVDLGEHDLLAEHVPAGPGLAEAPQQPALLLGPGEAALGVEPLRVVGVELVARSEEHTSELQSRENLVCRLLLEKKKRAT